MVRSRAALLVVVLAALLAVAAGCGGGGDDASGGETTAQEVPANAVAVVAGTPVTRTEFDRVFAQAESAYEAQGREFPKAGTSEYQTLQNQAVDFLVQRIELEKEAEALGITVTDADVQTKLEELQNQYFEGDQAKYEQELKKEGLTEEEVRIDLRAQLVSQKLFDQITKDVTVTPEEVQAYYDENQADFTTPESRQVAHILVDTKKEAEAIHQQLVEGADFAALAEEKSKDEASAKDGGEFEAQKGTLVPEFEEVAFALETGELSEPVESEFGWHVIQAVGDVTPERAQPFDEVQKSIEDLLLQQKRNDAMAEWVTGIESKYAGQVAYAVGFQPISTPAADTSDAATGTTP